MTTWSRLLAAVLFTGCGTTPIMAQKRQVPQISVPVTAFMDISVIPMDRERVLARQTVVVRGDRIIALGPTARIPVPAGATQVDGRGKFLLPGLADMHAHVGVEEPIPDSVAERTLLSYVAYGVTTIRNMRGMPQHLTLRARAAKGELLSPRIYAAGPALSISINSPDSAMKLVAAVKAAGYDLFKLHARIPRVVFDSLVVAAKRAQLPIAADIQDLQDDWGPGDSIDTRLTDLLRAHIASVEHLGGYQRYLSDTGWTPDLKYLWSHLDESKIPALATAMKSAGVWSVPTEQVWEANGAAIAGGVAFVLKGDTPSDQEREIAARKLIEINHKLVRALYTAGAGLLIGTDAPTQRQKEPGALVHEELALFVAAGLTPYQALESGTRKVAEFLGTLDSTGTIAVGKRADLVLLRANPLIDIRNTLRREGTMVGGRWLPQSLLEARLTALGQTWFGGPDLR